MTGPNGKVRDGVILCGVFTVLIASLFTPFSLVTIWFLPLPFFLYTVRHSWPSALFPAAVLGALALILLHPLWIFGVLFAAATGMAMGAFYRSTAASGTDVVLAGLVVGAAVLLLGLAAAQYGFGLLSEFQRLWQEQWDLVAEMVQNSVPEASVPPLPPLSAVLPLFLSVLTVPTVLLSAWAGRRFLVRSGFPEKRLPPFHRWRFPKSFLFYYLVSCVAAFLFDAESWAYSFFAGSFMILDILFAVQGLSFLSFLLHRKGLSRGWLWLAVFALFLPPAAFLLLVLGIMDVGTRMRERLEEGS
ncbi:Uncharacterized conserved protein YybS, DUF2232 family [Planifilum fulgidum]|uniref:Uncharacterized conserved protein YybS, DUF2232 family n=1 Tax=Planifilum fulgidum TaxID=201973 RepID=A0A1I2LIN3_9BACL|nr:DUF2232 domain-containing protein [Planifilum fulgidum]MBO2496402.1 DUF2232 domain-containing protein [Bacillota bacterium]MBO2531308.1 DUF2232 domain-containing protein [Thermoactinomycetaceae bacterium]SFF78310.1 Uncharacterized conserved protein YybS, DUF2232 family [Planifilum fulgidum]